MAKNDLSRNLLLFGMSAGAGHSFGPLQTLDPRQKKGLDILIAGNSPAAPIKGVSPAGTAATLPIDPTAGGTAGGPVPLAPLMGAAPPPAQAVQMRPNLQHPAGTPIAPTRAQGPMSQLAASMAQPAMQQFLGTMAQAFSGGREGAAGTILGRSAVQQAQGTASRRFFERLMAGEDPSKISGPDVDILSPEARSAAIAQAEAIRQGQRQDTKLELDEREVAARELDVASTVQYRAEQTESEREKIAIDRFRANLQERGVDLEASDQVFRHQIQRDQLRLQETVVASENRLRSAQTLLAEANAWRTRAEPLGPSGGGAGSLTDWTLHAQRLSAASRGFTSDYVALRMERDTAQQILDNFAAREHTGQRLTEQERRRREMAQQTVNEISPYLQRTGNLATNFQQQVERFLANPPAAPAVPTVENPGQRGGPANRQPFDPTRRSGLSPELFRR